MSKDTLGEGTNRNNRRMKPLLASALVVVVGCLLTVVFFWWYWFVLPLGFLITFFASFSLYILSKQRNQVDSALQIRTKELKESEETAKKLSQENITIAQIGRIIGSRLDVDEVYESFAQEVKKLIPFDGLAINIINHEESTVSVPYISGLAALGCQRGDVFPLEGSATGEIMRTGTGRIIHLEDKEDLRTKFPILFQAFDQGLCSVIVVPLISKDKVIGTMHIRSLTSKAYSQQDLELAEKIGFQIAGAIANAQLFEELKKEEAALKKSEKQYRLLAENVSDVIWIRDMNLKCTYVSPSIEKLTGFTVEEAMALTPEETYTPESLVTGLRVLEEEFSLEKDRCSDAIRVRTLEFEAFRKDGSKIWTESNMIFLRDSNGQIVGIQGVSRDISERKRAEETLREREAHYRLLAENSSDVIWTVDLGMQLTYISPSVTRLLGYTVEEAMSRSMTEAFTPASLEAAQQKFLEVITRERAGQGNPNQSQILEIELNHKDGTVVQVEGNFSLIRDALGEPVGLLAIVRDISERKRAEAELKSSLSLLSASLESTADGILIVDRQGKITRWNQKFTAMWNLPEEVVASRDDDKAINHVLSQLAEPEQFLSKVRELYAHPEESSFDQVTFRDGRIFARYSQPQRIENTIVGRVWSFRDITDRKRMEEERIIMSKLESTGILAGGIAHDFNNLLQAILGNLEMAQLKAQTGEEMTNSLKNAQKAALEARGLTLQLITLAQGGDPLKKVTTLSGLLQEQVTFSLRGTQIVSEFSIPADLWPVEVDEGQIGQVIRNLVLNAREAMMEGGMVSVGAANIGLTNPLTLPLPAGDYVKVSIFDQGNGIPEDILLKIFDPYFSTKQRGKQKGMGLGLTICRSIIQKHGGAITVETKLGQGTTFHVYLPASKETLPAIPLIQEGLPGTGRILVMDDEELVRSMSGMMLQRLGYEVELVENGEIALERYLAARNLGHPFDVVILDLTVRGGMGGKETIHELIKNDSTVKAIVSSGYYQDPVILNYEQYGFKAALTKPYLIGDLSEILSRLLVKNKPDNPTVF